MLKFPCPVRTAICVFFTRSLPMSKVWREQHVPNSDGINDLSATPPQDEQAPANDLSTLSPTGQMAQVLTRL